MCFGSLTTVERCDRCGLNHPGGLDEHCLDVAAARAAGGLEAELSAYLASNEARFFAWLILRVASRP
jgi:hypothetical protein